MSICRRTDRRWGVCISLESIMERLKLGRSLKARLAGTAYALVASLSCMAAVVAMFASASGELEPLLVKFEPAAAASAVVAKVRSKPAPS
jgi:hypothetical protein